MQYGAPSRSASFPFVRRAVRASPSPRYSPRWTLGRKGKRRFWLSPLGLRRGASRVAVRRVGGCGRSAGAHGSRCGQRGTRTAQEAAAPREARPGRGGGGCCVEAGAPPRGAAGWGCDSCEGLRLVCGCAGMKRDFHVRLECVHVVYTLQLTRSTVDSHGHGCRAEDGTRRPECAACAVRVRLLRWRVLGLDAFDERAELRGAHARLEVTHEVVDGA